MVHLSQRLTTLSLGLTVEGGLIFVAWVMGWLLNQSPFESLDWNWLDTSIGLLATLPLLILFLILLVVPFKPIVQIRDFFDEVVLPFFRHSTWFDFALISLCAGLGEEMVFRGVLQPYLAQNLGDIQALLLASLIFGLMHLITLTYAILTAIIGIYLGWIWMETGNLLTVVIIHALYDFLALCYLKYIYWQNKEPPEQLEPDVVDIEEG